MKSLFMITIVLVSMGCHNFSQFDCFQEENGCKDSSDASIALAGSMNAQGWVLDEKDQSGTEAFSTGTHEIEGGATAGTLTEDNELQPEPTVNVCDSEEQLACQSCVNGEIVPNNQDESCEIPQCNLLDRYLTRDQGAEPNLICVQEFYKPINSLCSEGECLDPNDLASACVLDREEILISLGTVEECRVLRGCSGIIGPETDIRIGESCGQEKICDEQGQCVLPQPTRRACTQSGDYFNLCLDVQEPQRNYCDFDVNLLFGLGVLSNEDCNEFCNEQGGECIAAWNVEGRCRQNSSRECGSNGGQAICRCRF